MAVKNSLLTSHAVTIAEWRKLSLTDSRQLIDCPVNKKLKLWRLGCDITLKMLIFVRFSP